MPHNEKKEGAKLNHHEAKVELHAKEHAAHVQAKEGVYSHKNERHPGDGHAIKENPKKGGGGKGGWGTFKDDIVDLKEEGVIA